MLIPIRKTITGQTEYWDTENKKVVLVMEQQSKTKNTRGKKSNDEK